MATWRRRIALTVGGIVGLGATLCGTTGVIGLALPGEMQLQEVAELEAPAAAIYDHLDDHAGLAAWWAVAMDHYAQEHGSEMGMTVEHVVGTPASGVGCRVDFMAGGMAAERWEILALEPSRRAVYDVDFKIFRVERTLTLEALGGGRTRMTWVESGTIGNPWVRLIVRGMGSDGARENFRGAMEALEAAATSTGSVE